MVVIGICGGIAAGKSLVARELERRGAVLIDADRLGHEALEDIEVKQAIRQRWGAAVFRKDGSVDRSALAKIVFAPPPSGTTELRHLEQITHPLITEKLRQRLHQLEQQNGITAVVLDAPVMFRAGWNEFCHHVLFVDAPYPVRLARARQRGWSEQELKAREAAQESLEWKRQRADRVIDNSGTPEHTSQQIEQFWQSISRESL